MSDDMATCEYCGDDGYFEWELNNGACKTCEVEACPHPKDQRDRNYMGSNHQRARFEEVCINCGCFREARVAWHNNRIHYTKWQHDDVPQDEIPQEDSQ